MMTKDRDLIGDTINTISGEAEYFGTEYEDSEGKWNDDYSTAQGYYVIHTEKAHHVYKVI